MKADFSRIIGLLALRFRDNEAIVNIERNRRYSFAEYHRLTNRIANAMRTTLGLGKGDRYLAILENDNLHFVLFPTSLKQESTGAFVNYRESIDEHTWQIDLLKPKVVFLEAPNLARYLPMLQERGITVVVMDAPDVMPPGVLSFWDIVDAASDADPGLTIDMHDHAAMLRFTGGTTGRGKCVEYSADNLMALRDGFYTLRDFAMDDATRCLHMAPLSHASMMPFVGTFFAGGTTLTLNQVDLARWIDLVPAERVTHSFLVPTLLYRLLEMQKQQRRDLSSLHTIVYGTSPMSPSKLAELIKVMGNVFVQGYGSSECLTCVCVLGKADHLDADGNLGTRLSSAGRVLPGVELWVTDAAGQPVPAGVTGEIRIRGRATIKGYFGNPEATASEFIDGAWKSGDLGYIDEDGYVFIVDRLKDMIITGGFHVFAVEVEAALSSHPAVLMSAVVGIPHDEWGEAVHAEVVLRDGARVTAEELIDHVKTKLGAFKAPKTVAFTDALPMSPVGKVLRRQVKARYCPPRTGQV
jgi:acyl-CoA synthetase (AMP-forming)/AMP-acid ligase II